jgi:glycolate oxidase FAD binding subunit
MTLIETPPGQDLTDALVERVLAASNARTPLRIVGGDTKRFYGRPVAGETLALGGHHGVLRYDPAELVITARGGTQLADIEVLLARHGQRLPFDPPSFGPSATLGGTVAAGLAGPARVARGPVRDYVLGARLLTGDGRVLKFGGEVMKNVAGYDVSRLLAGSLGILGVLLDVSLKVLPVARGTRTLRRQIAAQGAIDLFGAAAQRGLPLTASFWSADELYVRLEGSPAGVDEVAPTIGGELLDESVVFSLCHSVREQPHAALASAPRLWRLPLPATAAGAALVRADRVAFEWNGAQVWINGGERQAIDLITRTTGGHATLFRRDDTAVGETSEVFAPLPAPMLDLHRAVKRVFDPAGILNPGRMYMGL